MPSFYFLRSHLARMIAVQDARPAQALDLCRKRYLKLSLCYVPKQALEFCRKRYLKLKLYCVPKQTLGFCRIFFALNFLPPASASRSLLLSTLFETRIFFAVKTQ